MQENTLPKVHIIPPGPHRVGDSVRILWSFVNISEDPMHHVVIRFVLPSTLTLNVARSFTFIGIHDGPGFDDWENGISIETVQPGQSVRISISATVTTVSNNRHKGITAALTLDGGREYTSPPEDLEIVAKPNIIARASKIYTLKADGAHMGAEFTFANDGDGPAENVIIRIPTPPGFSVFKTVLADGITDNGGEYTRIIGVGSIAPRGSDGDFVTAGIQYSATAEAYESVEFDEVVLSYDGGEVSVEPRPFQIEREVDLSTSEIRIGNPEYGVQAGDIIDVRLIINNTGRSPANAQRVAINLPQALSYCPGSISINGSVDSRINDPRMIPLEIVRRQSKAIILLRATVKSPIADGTRATISATIGQIADNGEVAGYDIAPTEFEIRSAAAFPLSENMVTTEEPTTIERGKVRTFSIRLVNVGADAARNVRLRVSTNDLVIERAELRNPDNTTSLVSLKPVGGQPGDSTIELGTLSTRQVNTIQITVRPPETFEPEQICEFRAAIRHAATNGAEIELGGVDLIGYSRPHFDADTSEIRSIRDDDVRIDQIRAYQLRLENTGSAKALGITVDLDLPAILILERIDNHENVEAIVDSGLIYFREVPARGSAEATIYLRIAGSPEGTNAIRLMPIVSCVGVSTFRLNRLTLVSSVRPFLDEATTAVIPVPETSDVTVSLTFKNAGDGTAYNVLIVADDMPSEYIANSTRIRLYKTENMFTPSDVGGRSILETGFLISKVKPNMHITIEYRVSAKTAKTILAKFTIHSETQGIIVPEAGQYMRPSERRFTLDLHDGNDDRPRIEGQSERRRPSERPKELYTKPILAITTDDHPEIAEQPHPKKPKDPRPQPHPTFNDPEIAERPTVIPAAAKRGNDLRPQTIPPREPRVAPSIPEREPRIASPIPPEQRVNEDYHDMLVGPIGLLNLGPKQIRRKRLILDQVLDIDNFGYYRHLFGIRLFMPAHILGIDEKSDKQWYGDVYQRAAMEHLRTPLSAATSPLFQPTLQWAAAFDDLPTKMVAAVAVNCLTSAGTQATNVDPRDIGERDLYGSIGYTFQEYFSKESQYHGEHLNRVIAETLPTNCTHHPELGEAIGRYRKGVVQLFEILAFQSPEKRHERMINSKDGPLDEILTEIRELLQEPRWNP